MKAWESKNAKNAARAGGVSLMALSLAACGGSSSDDATPFAQIDITNAVDAAKAVAAKAQTAAVASETAKVTAAEAAKTLAETAKAAAEAEATAATAAKTLAETAKAAAEAEANTAKLETIAAEAARDLAVLAKDAAAEAKAEAVKAKDAADAALVLAKAETKAAADALVVAKDAQTAANLAKVEAESARDLAVSEKTAAEAKVTAAELAETTAKTALAAQNEAIADAGFANLAALITALETATNPDEVTNFILLTTADVVAGGASATVISGTAGTIDGDNINGGDGADTLNLTVTLADDDNSAFTSTSVETVSIRSTGGTVNDAAFVDLNLADVTGMETLQLRRLGDDVEIDDLGDLTTTIELNNIATAADVNINYDAATVAGAENTVNVSIVSSTGGGDLVINDVETIAVTVTGTDNDMNIDGDSIEVVTIAGTGDLNVDFDASVTSANASTNSGGVTMNATAAADVTFTGGTVADTFSMGGTLTAADTLAGGDGADTLIVTGGAGAAIPASAAVTSVETLRIETAAAGAGVATTLDANVVSFETITHDVSNAADTLTITDYTDATLNLVESAGDALDLIDVTFVDATSTSDALTINITNSDATTAFTVDDINSTGGGIETLNLVLNQGVDIADASDILVDDISSTHTTVNISGDADATLGTDAGLTATTVSAVAATGDLTINVGAAASNVTGGSGADTFAFAGNLGSTDVIIGGDGADTLTAAMAAGAAAATMSGVQTATLEFGTAGASFSGVNVDDLTTITIDAASDEAVTLTNLDDTVTSVRIGSTAAGAAGDAAAIRYTTGSSSSHTLNIGDNTATPAADVDVGNITVSGNAGALTMVSDAFTGNSVFSLTANNATSLSISSTEALEFDADGAGAGTIAATAATSATLTTAGGAILVDGATDVRAATSISLVGADGDLTQTGAVTATAMETLTMSAAAGVTTTLSNALTSDADVSLVTLTATGAAADLSVDGLLDVDHVRTIDVTATGGANIDIADVELLGVDNDAATDIDVSLNLTSNGQDAADNSSTITVAALNTATATLDTVTIVSDADGVVSLTSGGANLTITTIDASGSAGTLTLDTSVTAAAISANFGSGTNTITTEVGLADTLTLLTSSGTDTVNVQSDNAGTSAADIVVNFEAGNNGDVLALTVAELDGSGSDVVNGSGTTLSAALAVNLQTDADGALTIAAGTNVIVLTDIFADNAGVTTALTAGATTASAVIADDDNLLVVWTDGADSYLTRFQINDADPDADGGGGASTIDGFDEVEDLVILQGVTVTDLTADNFSFI